MTNLDSILKSRDITSPTNIRTVKHIVFPVVMYEFESWTIKKAEYQRIDAFELWCWRRLLRVPWTARKSNLNILWKDWCWSWNCNMLATLCEEPTHWKRPWCWERLKAEGEGDNRGWDGWMAPPTQWTWVWENSRRWETWCAAVHGVTKSWTQLSEWTTTMPNRSHRSRREEHTERDKCVVVAGGVWRGRSSSNYRDSKDKVLREAGGKTPTYWGTKIKFHLNSQKLWKQEESGVKYLMYFLVFCCAVSFKPPCAACRILVPWPGIEPGPLHGEHSALTTELSGKSLWLRIFDVTTAKGLELTEGSDDG